MEPGFALNVQLLLSVREEMLATLQALLHTATLQQCFS
jgi:hypothetical protein